MSGKFFLLLYPPKLRRLRTQQPLIRLPCNFARLLWSLPTPSSRNCSPIRSAVVPQSHVALLGPSEHFGVRSFFGSYLANRCSDSLETFCILESALESPRPPVRVPSPVLVVLLSRFAYLSAFQRILSTSISRLPYLPNRLSPGPAALQSSAGHSPLCVHQFASRSA